MYEPKIYQLVIGNVLVIATRKMFVAISNVADGTMKKTGHINPKIVDENRRQFLKKYHQTPEQAVLVQLDYNSEDFCRYKTIDETSAGDGIAFAPSIISDGLVTKTPGLVLFLPLADCVGAVLYDQTQHILMLSHLGRHNLEQNGGQRSVEYLMQEHNINPAHVKLWLSPSAGKDSYPLYQHDHKSLQDVTITQLINAGINKNNIIPSSIDTTKDSRYFSHSEFKKGNRAEDGRYVMIAMLK